MKSIDEPFQIAWLLAKFLVSKDCSNTERQGLTNKCMKEGGTDVTECGENITFIMRALMLHVDMLFQLTKEKNLQIMRGL